MSLERFISAQEKDYDRALSEIKKGRKTTHWMWYVFPQIAGLGTSETAKFYSIIDFEEARKFLHHPLLGPRLLEISRAMLALPGSNATHILGSPDDAKLQSCMTLFSAVQPAEPVFRSVLDKFYAGEKDSRTLQIIGVDRADRRGFA